MKASFFIITFILLTNSLQAQIKFFNKAEKSSITYAMNHPLHSWTGESKKVKSVILSNADKTEISQVAVAVSIASFDSKNANRDSHAMEVTEALKFPNIVFSSNQIERQGDKLMVKGILKFHGIAKSISFTAQTKKIGDNLQVKGGFSIKMTDFGIEPPSLMAMSTDDEIKLSFIVYY